MIRAYTLYLFFIALVIASCSNKHSGPLVVENFELFENFNFEGDTLELQMDLSGGVFEPIQIPSRFGLDGDTAFKFTFTVNNQSPNRKELSYKIYYQNISYSHALVKKGGDYNPKSSENFYGSWISDSLISFKEFDIAPNSRKQIEDYFFISGNPLNDPRYFDTDPAETLISPEMVAAKMESIRRDSTWMKAIAKKARERNKAMESQLRDDALWTLKNHAEHERKNRRWQRNPRVGLYEFMLVIASKEYLAKLPPEILNPLELSPTYNSRVNPFFYFNQKALSESEVVKVVMGNTYLRTYAVLSPSYGLFFDPGNFSEESYSGIENCNSSDQNHLYAHFQQYVNTEVRDSALNNINIAGNVVGENYSNARFQEISRSSMRLPESYVESPLSPCINAQYDAAEGAIILTNPGNESRPYRKENAGVEGRIGFTYGKFRGVIRFPEVMSSENVWNGITCAYWLKFQSLKEWNRRDSCLSSGYLQQGYSREEAVYDPADSYSEIDIEIVKTSKYWPSTNREILQSDSLYDPARDNNLIVTCTNWDLACQDPTHFGIGSRPFKGGKYYTHRWTDYYKALTIKTESPHDSTVGEVMYYEIDWRPDEIIWRIGKSPSAMKEVGYMDSSITKIPNNQMVPVMSQEFHYGHWWPTTPYPQGDIPFPKDPIKGYLYGVEVR